MITSQLLFKKTFRRWILYSITGHFVLFLLMIFASPNIFSRSRSTQIKQTVRVDMVGLPDIKRTSTPKKKKVQKKKKASRPKKKASRPKKKASRPKKKATPKKSQKKKSTPKKPVDTRAAQADAIEKLKQDQSLEPPTYKGEKISKGQSQDGEISTVLLNAYFDRVKMHVIRYWNLPQWLADKDLRATVIIQVNSYGDITRIELERTSGNETFDQVVIDTIRTASPLPEPLPELNSVLKQGVGFHFPE